MSSILRALRKLENAVPDTERVHSLPIHMGSDSGTGRRNRGLRRLSMVLGGLVVLILLFFSAVYLYGRNFTLIQKILPNWGAYPSDRQTKISQPVKIPPVAQKSNKTVPPQRKPRSNKRVTQPAAPQPKASSNLPRRSPNTSTATSSAAKRIPPSKKISPRTARASSAATRSRRRNIPASTPPLPRKTKTLNDDGIKVQAIAWSEDPQDRITVINGKILREGDTFEELTIADIQQDSVIVRKGTKSMTIEFRIK